MAEDLQLKHLGFHTKVQKFRQDVEGLQRAILVDQINEHPMRRSNCQVHKDTMKELNPVSDTLAERAEVLAKTRDFQTHGAQMFLSDGEGVQDWGPSYGKVWNRDYNVRPYPEALPDSDMYTGTGIGFLYGFFGESGEAGWEHAWTMAGWNLVRTGAEVRTRKKPK